MRALLVALAISGCAGDVCRGVDGTCVALTVRGAGAVDGLKITLSGAATGSKVAPPEAKPQALPVEVALAPANAGAGTLHIDVLGVLLGNIVGRGSVDVAIKGGAHRTASLTLGSGDGAAGDGGVNDVPFDVTGTRVRHYLLGDGGVVDVPTDFTGNPISALAPTDGGVTTIAGSGDAMGNFRIPRVPARPYYLRYYSNFVYGSSAEPDLSAYILGRADQTQATLPTTLSLNVSNAAPWATGDMLELFSLNAGTAIFGLESFFNPASGATQLGGSFDLSKLAYGKLIDASKGDDVFLLQLVADSNGGVPYQRLAKQAGFARFTVTNGSSQSQSAAMTDLAQNGSLSFAWARSQFAQYRAAINAQAGPDYDTFDVFAQPGGLAHGTFSSTPDVAIANPTPGNTDVSMSMTFANPFPSSWPLVAAAGTNYSVSYTATGASAQSFDGAVWTYAPAATLPSPVVPLVSPAQNATIDGQDAFTAQTGLSPTPLIAWSAPALGSPSSYALYLYGIYNRGGKTALEPEETFYTTLTSVRIPPGLLAANQSYFFVITAFADSIDHSVTPFAAALPAGYADVLSAPFTVSATALGASCKAILDANPGLPDGIYTIDTDGSGPMPPVPVSCDMTTAGGGWTLCAWSKDAAAESIGWAPPSTTRSSNWYACHSYSNAPVDTLVVVANSQTKYSNQYANVDFRSSGATETAYMPSLAQSPNFTLQVRTNGAACSTASAGNYQFGIVTTSTIFGQAPHCNCGNCASNPSTFISSSGAHTNGCAGSGQIPPEIGFPCGGDGNFGVHMELWAR